MRKLSNITESIWSDIQKRSGGETVRKEDEIDILDGVDLFKYLTKKYKTIHSSIGIVESTSIISIPLAGKISLQSAFNITYPLYFDYSEHIVLLYEYNKKHMEMDLPQLWKKLNDKFTILTTNPKYKNRVLICPSETDINATNTFLIEVIDFIIDNLPKRSSIIYPLIVKNDVNESIWSDIQKRSSGETVRKEDDINNLNRDDFYDYIESHYKTLNSFVNIFNSSFFNRIDVPVLIKDGEVFNVYFKYTDNKYIFIGSGTLRLVKGLSSILADKFSLKKDSENPLIHIISPKDGGEVTNTFFIEVVDFIIDNIPDSFERGVKKIVNESIWSDIQKRSAGDTIRKEDEIVSNIKKLEPVDMGVSVLWADKDLEVDENVYLSYTDVEKIIKNSGWRLPTSQEFYELSNNTAEYKNTFEEYKLHSGKLNINNDLIFKKCGFQYADTYGSPRGYGAYYAWTSDVSRNENEAYQTIKIDRYIRITTMHYLNRCCTRLVKDK